MVDTSLGISVDDYMVDTSMGTCVENAMLIGSQYSIHNLTSTIIQVVCCISSSGME